MPPAAHSCLAYAGESEFRTAAADYLSDAPAFGQQAGYVGWGEEPALRDRITELSGVNRLAQRGGLHLDSFDRHFRPDEPPEPQRWLEFWSSATDEATRAGYSALRVVADTTPWASLDHQRRGLFLKGEHLIDRYRIHHPLALLCAFDAYAPDAAGLAETVCIHPVARGAQSPFHLHAAENGDAAMSGESDAFAVPLLQRVLETIPSTDGRELVIDATGLTFIDHHSLEALDRHAEGRNVPGVVLRNASPTTNQVATLMGLRHLRVEVAP